MNGYDGFNFNAPDAQGAGAIGPQRTRFKR